MSLIQLSSGELDVMNVLWERGKLNGRDVHRFINGPHKWSYNATQAVLGRLVTKGFISSQGFTRFNDFEAKITRAQGLAAFVKHFSECVMRTPSGTLIETFRRLGIFDENVLRELERLTTAKA